MSEVEFQSIDDYQQHLITRLADWTPRQYLLLAACLAERWLPAYERFSADEDWGDPALLRRCLDAAWLHISGRTLNTGNVEESVPLIDDVTPHMDDFDALDALMACWVVTETLQACSREDNAAGVVSDMPLQILENMVEEWPVGGDAEAKVWQSQDVREEVQAQLQIVGIVKDTTDFSAAGLESLQDRTRGLQRVAAPRPRSPITTGITNEAAFEAYRRSVESDLSNGPTGGFDPGGDPHLLGLHGLGIWVGRYSRRLQTINGEFGRLKDELGRAALIARNHAHDLAAGETPDWHAQTLEMIEMCLANNSQSHTVDAGSVMSPHSYGPSLRLLWLEGRRCGRSADDAWTSIARWAAHQPAAWSAEDQRKQKRWHFTTPELGELLARQLIWRTTDDPDHPWTTDVDGRRWQVRMNDFPDELMYGLIIDGECAGNFHDWPEPWSRRQAKQS